MRVEATICVQGALLTVRGDVTANAGYDGSAYHRAAQPIENEFEVTVGACFDEDGLCDPWEDYDLEDDELREALLGAYLDEINDLRPALEMAA